MAKQKLNKKQIDENVLRLLVLDEAIKTLQKEFKGIKNNLESQYSLDKSVRETISGIQTEFEKIPVNNGAHAYDVAKAKLFAQAVGKESEVIATIEVVNADKFEELVKLGFLAPENLDVCRQNKWTFKSDFRRKEAVAQGEKVSKKAVEDAIAAVLPKAEPAKRSSKKAAGQ